MRWPLVTRKVHDLEIAHRDGTIADLRTQLATCREMNERLTRVRGGVPRDVDRPPRESIPREIEDEIRGYDSQVVRRQLRMEARQARQEGEDWDDILGALRAANPVGAG